MSFHPNDGPSVRPETFSQTGQDFWVIGEVFNEMRHGFFLEVGSADGISLSNTYLLEREYGWMGICVEADPEYFAALQQTRSAICVNACVDANVHEVEFARRKLHGGIQDRGLDNEPGQCPEEPYSTVRMTTRPLVEILSEHMAPPVIDYLSIDVEGAEERILGSFPFESYRFRCMTVERPKPMLRKVLEDNGYVIIKEIPGYDVFYIHRSFMSDYVANVFAFWTKPSEIGRGAPTQRHGAMQRPWRWSRQLA
jgi:FkbM family methyltransferase